MATPAAPVVAAGELAEFVRSAGLDLDDSGAPRMPLVLSDLGDGTLPANLELPETVIVVGIGAGPGASALDCTIVAPGAAHSRAEVECADPDAARAAIESTVRASPRAAVTLAGLLRASARSPVGAGLVAESAAYSMLLAAAEFRTWRAGTPRRRVPEHPGPAVRLRRDGGTLSVVLDRPRRHNAFGRELRDALNDAFDLVLRDGSITRVELSGAGPSFCSGGDLDEFGTGLDVSTAHLVRLDRSVARRLERCRERVHVTLHGACIGAGIEVPSFAAHVSARRGTVVQLPELAMGLVPGAGGTVGITRRVGRWRTAFLAFTGARVDADTALSWGLVDDVVD